MTTIVAIHTNDGVVVVADKRQTFIAVDSTQTIQRTFFDAGEKIQPIGNHCVLAVAGEFRTSMVTAGDVYQLVGKQLRNKLAKGNFALNNVTKDIQTEFVSAYQSYFRTPAGSPFTALVVNYNGSAFEANRYEVAKNGTVHPQQRPTSIGLSPSARPVVLGVDEFLVNHAQSPYQDLQNDYCWSAKWKDVSLQQGFTTAIRIIKETHHQHPESVGETVDGLVLRPNGVEWRLKNENLDAAGRKFAEKEGSQILNAGKLNVLGFIRDYQAILSIVGFSVLLCFLFLRSRK